MCSGHANGDHITDTKFRTELFTVVRCRPVETSIDLKQHHFSIENPLVFILYSNNDISYVNTILVNTRKLCDLLLRVSTIRLYYIQSYHKLLSNICMNCIEHEMYRA